MSTVYIYAQQNADYILTVPASDNITNEIPALEAIRKVTVTPGTSVESLTNDQVKDLVGRTFRRSGDVPSFSQVTFYDGSDYGKSDRKIVHTRQV